MSSSDLKKILNNKTLGSSELTNRLNKYFLSNKENISAIKKAVTQAKTRLGHFQDVNSYLDKLKSVLKKNNAKKLNQFLKGYSKREEDKIQNIFNKLYPKVKKLNSVITLSRSGTVIRVLKLWHKKNKKLKVVVCESRPKFEGRLTASELVKSGIKVELITDAMMGIFIEKIDCILIGSDSILKNGNVINKVGSKALALLCKETKKSLYVVATTSKLSKKNTFKAEEENPNEIWDKNFKNLKIKNIYFEEVEKKLITKIITD
jgi:translation initiation factor 2B subunit (eIF-2B alpha/beta/delta family)